MGRGVHYHSVMAPSTLDFPFDKFRAVVYNPANGPILRPEAFAFSFAQATIPLAASTWQTERLPPPRPTSRRQYEQTGSAPGSAVRHCRICSIIKSQLTRLLRKYAGVLKVHGLWVEFSSP